MGNLGGRRVTLAALQLVLDRLSDERRHALGTNERFDAPPYVIAQSHESWLHVQRRSPHAWRGIRYRKFCQRKALRKRYRLLTI